MAKNMTVRLSDELARELEAVSQVDQTPVAETVRQAIADRIESRRRDKDFQARLRRIMEENQQALERLAR
jgi:predicted transcriptional regulator